MQQHQQFNRRTPEHRGRDRHDTRGHNLVVVVDLRRVPLVPFKKALQGRGFLVGVTDRQVTMELMQEFVTEHGRDDDVQATYLRCLQRPQPVHANGR